jgi:membrane-associated protease RseP (regulator of RpoE activity)
MFVAIPLSFHFFPVDGIIVTSLNTELNPIIATSDLQKGDVIEYFDGDKITEIYNLSYALQGYEPGDEVVLGTQRGDIPITLGPHPLNSSVPVIGINLEARVVPRYTSSTMRPVNAFMEFLLGLPSKALGMNNDRFTWIEYFYIAMSPLKLAGVLTLINVFSLGLGTANLIPAWIFDGGRMMNIVARRVTGKEKSAREIMHWLSLLFILFLLALVFVPMFRAMML